MSNFMLSFGVVFPLFALMALGYVMTRLMKIERSVLNKINKMVFTVFLPVILFKNIYDADLSAGGKPLLFITCSIGTIVSFFIIWFVLSRSVKNRRDCATMVQGCFRSNNVLFGITIIGAIYHDQNALAMASLLAAVTVFFYNMLVVFLFQTVSSEKVTVKTMIKGILTNPMIIATILGAFFLFSGLKLPALIYDVVGDVGQIATPLALIVLGGTFTFEGLHEYRRKLSVCALCKLIILPAVMLPVGIALGFRGAEIVCVLSLFGSPTAVASFAMADQMGGNGELAGEIIVVNSICSILTIFCWTFLLGAFKML